jgi:hypothetical protein
MTGAVGAPLVLDLRSAQRFLEKLVSSLFRLNNSKKFPHNPPGFLQQPLVLIDLLGINADQKTPREKKYFDH